MLTCLSEIQNSKSEQEQILVLEKGHTYLLENSSSFKLDLIKKSFRDTFEKQLIRKLEIENNLNSQSRLLAILEEINVSDPTRIGEPLIATLIHDLKTKAYDDFEFVKGDKNLSLCLLNLIVNDDRISSFIKKLCVDQQKSGIATPFDYRRLTLGFKGRFETATVEEWSTYFSRRSLEQLESYLEIGKSFSSTKPQRYDDKEEEFLVRNIKGIQKLLDIGGSIGVNALHLKELLGIKEVIVTDSRSKKDLKKSFYGKFIPDQTIKYILGNQGNIVYKTPSADMFDLITVNNVLVHIREKEIAIANILPRLNQGGYLIISGGYNANSPSDNFKLFQKSDRGIDLLKRF